MSSELSSDTSPASPISEYNPPKQHWQTGPIILYELLWQRGTEIFEIDASWAEKLTKTIVQFLLAPTVIVHLMDKKGKEKSKARC